MWKPVLLLQNSILFETKFLPFAYIWFNRSMLHGNDVKHLDSLSVENTSYYLLHFRIHWITFQEYSFDYVNCTAQHSHSRQSHIVKCINAFKNIIIDHWADILWTSKGIYREWKSQFINKVSAMIRKGSHWQTMLRSKSLVILHKIFH